MSASALKLFAGTLFALPYGVMAAFGLATGLVICFMLVGGGIPVPWRAIGMTIAATVVFGLVGTFALATISTRSALPDAE